MTHDDTPEQTAAQGEVSPHAAAEDPNPDELVGEPVEDVLGLGYDDWTEDDVDPDRADDEAFWSDTSVDDAPDGTGTEPGSGAGSGTREPARAPDTSADAELATESGTEVQTADEIDHAGDADDTAADAGPSESRHFYLAPSLAKLYRDEINALWPDRDRASDGWVGDTSHAARTSDHNPDWDDNGVVRAVDIDRDGIDVRRLLAEVIGDPRVWYVIHQLPDQPPTIWSRTHGWAPNRYTGSNPHDKHVHISIVHTSEAENDTRDWFGSARPDRRRPRRRRVRLEAVQTHIRTRAAERSSLRDVRTIQRELNRQYGAGLDVDGLWGPATARAWKRHEIAADGNGNRWPGAYALRKLSRSGRRFRAVA